MFVFRLLSQSGCTGFTFWGREQGLDINFLRRSECKKLFVILLNLNECIIKIKTNFYLSFNFQQSFRITSLQVLTEKLFQLTASICFHVCVYSRCLKA